MIADFLRSILDVSQSTYGEFRHSEQSLADACGLDKPAREIASRLSDFLCWKLSTAESVDELRAYICGLLLDPFLPSRVKSFVLSSVLFSLLHAIAVKELKVLSMMNPKKEITH